MLKKKCPAFISKHNSNCEKQGILLMNPNGEGQEVQRMMALSCIKKAISIIKRNNIYTLW